MKKQQQRQQKAQKAPTNKVDNDAGCCCNCKRKLDPFQLFDDNVEDIAKSLAQIMVLCGINTTKACNAKSIIKRAFVYHEKLRTTNPTATKGKQQQMRLHRDDMLQALRIKCDMDKVEGMLSYSIIKRAFKAFFHGKRDRTISNPIIDAMAVHDQKAAWLHAAYKTARVFDNYRAAFFWAHKSYERQISLVYRALFERMTARADPLTVPTCPCPKCSKREVPGHPKPGKKVHEKLKLVECTDLPEACIMCGLQMPKITNNVKVKPPRPILNHELKLPRCNKCNSPMLICECNIDQLTGEFYGECGQDSYKVKWYRYEDEEETAQPKKLDSANDSSTSYEDAKEPTIDWENHHCPIDCQPNTSSASSNVCKFTSSSNPDESSSYLTCSNVDSEDAVEKLERYLNKLWAEDIAIKKNPDTYLPHTVFPPHPPCEPCNR